MSAIRNHPQRVSLRDLEDVSTHDSILARGYQLGYVAALTEEQSDFQVTVLASIEELVTEILQEAGATVTRAEQKPNRFGVIHVLLTAKFA